MSVHQCPKCELRFTWRTELDAHCTEDHPDFHHEYKSHSWELKHAHDAEQSAGTRPTG